MPHADRGREGWTAEPTFSIYDSLEVNVGLLRESGGGRDAVRLGCGTAQVSAWLAWRGAQPVEIDAAPAQPATARALPAAFGLAFPVHLGDAGATLAPP